ncbi:hypothetical protein WJX84_009804 [Apatococcus fuscideae]|uniref:Protein kinase domain-containing protein n=1 Tax=Apatococcus fuscideae TaxID=2026836 RepID=A0AAW1SSV0_9CHLO
MGCTASSPTKGNEDAGSHPGPMKKQPSGPHLSVGDRPAVGSFTVKVEATGRKSFKAHDEAGFRRSNLGAVASAASSASSRTDSTCRPDMPSLIVPRDASGTTSNPFASPFAAAAHQTPITRQGSSAGRGPTALHGQLDPTTSMDLAALQRLSDIVDLVASSFQATSAMAVILDDGKEVLTFVPVEGFGCNRDDQASLCCPWDSVPPIQEVLLVTDTLHESRFAQNALVTGPMGIRSFAAAPLMGANGTWLGSLCVVDSAPDKFTPQSANLLFNFAAMMVRDVEQGLRVRKRRSKTVGLSEQLRHLAQEDEATFMQRTIALMHERKEILLTGKYKGAAGFEIAVSITFRPFGGSRSDNVSNLARCAGRNAERAHQPSATSVYYMAFIRQDAALSDMRARVARKLKREPFDDVKVGPLLGAGSYGRVYKGTWQGATVAVKVIEHMQTAKTAPTLDGTKTLLEAIVSIELSHPSVVHTYKFDTIPVTTSRMDPKQSAATAGSGMPLETWLVLECEKDERHFAAKVADFGLARTSTAQYIMTQTQGTLTHMPPEVLAEGKVTKSADVYAFGVILWEMFTGERPFAGMRHAQILEAVMSASSTPPLELSSRAPASFKKLVAMCMAFSREERPTFHQVGQMLDEVENETADTNVVNKTAEDYPLYIL